MVNHRLSDEHEALRKSVEQFARDVVAPQAEHADRTGEFPYDVIRQMGEMGSTEFVVKRAATAQ